MSALRRAYRRAPLPHVLPMWLRCASYENREVQLVTRRGARRGLVTPAFSPDVVGVLGRERGAEVFDGRDVLWIGPFEGASEAVTDFMFPSSFQQITEATL